MAKPDAATLRADPQAAAQLPADDPGVDEHLHAAPKHPRLLRLRAGQAAPADPPAAHPAVDGAGPTAAAILPADGAGVDEHLHADVQHPPLLPAGRDAPCSARRSTNRTEEIRKTNRRSSRRLSIVDPFADY